MLNKEAPNLARWMIEEIGHVGSWIDADGRLVATNGHMMVSLAPSLFNVGERKLRPHKGAEEYLPIIVKAARRSPVVGAILMDWLRGLSSNAIAVEDDDGNFAGFDESSARLFGIPLYLRVLRAAIWPLPSGLIEVRALDVEMRKPHPPASPSLHLALEGGAWWALVLPRSVGEGEEVPDA